MIDLLPAPLLHRLGLTVLHALWELPLIALLVWAGLALIRRYRASTRYALACVGLGAMVALPLVTWFRLEPLGFLNAEALNLTGAAVVAVSPVGGPALNPGLLRITQLAPWAALFWFAGVVVMLTRLGAGLWWLDRAYLRQASPVSAPWQDVLDRLAVRMGLARPVRLLESGRAESPLLLGWLKPAILVPSAALLQLNPAALEAVLAHELAHVRRHDYLMNLLQSFAEAMLFFHPCAWWLSRTIRELREHCCDDAAAALCGDPLILAEGLSALERLRHRLQPDPEPALAAAKGNLMSRIARLFQPQEIQAPSLRGLATALVAASLLGITAMAAQKPTPTPKPPSKASQPKVDTEGVADFDFSQIKILHQPKAPAYPPDAKEKRIQGTVIVTITLDEQGQPVTAKALEGPEELRLTATEYAKKWRFEPARVNGKPVKARFKLTMPFRLREDDKAHPKPGEAMDFDFAQIKIVHQPEAPAYPAEAKEKRIQGTVVVSITIDEQGIPQTVEALEGPEALRPTALDYAKAWRFGPAKSHGKPVKARFKLTMPFKLR